MILKINNIEINKYELLHLINNGKKINAIKLVKDKTKMGLKECKDIVNNLSDNPNFYDGKDYKPETDYMETFEKSKRPLKKRGSHIIENKSNSKNYIILILLLVSIVLGYLYINK